MDPQKKRRRVVALLAALALLVIGGGYLSGTCLSAWVRFGISVPVCPDGALHPTAALIVNDLRRDGAGWVRVRADAHYTTDASDRDQVTELSRATASVSLIDAAGKETPLSPAKGWIEEGPWRTAQLALPAVPDGDYRLRARVQSRVGEATVEAALPLYAPATLHVLTDRPLYEPGHTVRFRAVAFRKKDLGPLDGRPGTWRISDPSGELVYEERAPAGDWGVASGSFPLDRGAPVGTWKVSWRSGDAEEAASFRVEPFTVPRFRVEANALKPYYRAGERPEVKGEVRYSSGAPVSGAKVNLSWQSQGAWPPPADWMERTLPKEATADAGGQFTLTLPAIPADLRGRVTLSASLEAHDAAGDEVDGSAAVLLSEDPIQVSTVTELGEGLVQGLNNRVYLRVATADGVVLPKTKLLVKRAWDPRDPGLSAETDEDGVASLQLDPGTPINVVIPPMPVRPPPREPAVSRGSANDLFTDEEPSLRDQAELDRWLRPLEPCAPHAQGQTETVVGVRVAASGAVTSVVSFRDPLGECIAAVVRAQRLSPGKERMLDLHFVFSDHDLPGLSSSPTLAGPETQPEGLDDRLERATAAARSCFTALNRGGPLAQRLEWRAKRGEKAITVGWVSTGDREAVGAAAMPCMQARFGKLALDAAPEDDAIGTVSFDLTPSEREQQAHPQPTTLLGYELSVTARPGTAEAGTTRLIVKPGAVPPLRLRVTPVLASPGETLAVELLRGPNFSGALPAELTLAIAGKSTSVKIDAKSRSAKVALPAEAEGWVEVIAASARAVIYVQPRATLAVDLTPERARYAPGELARVQLQTRAGGAGTAAAVGLFGVDEGLAQLTPLPGPDAMAKIRPQAVVSQAAFGALDGQALAMGRIRGANAAAATILRITSVPATEAVDARVTTSANGTFDPVEALTDHFYGVLDELHAQARLWEEKAGKDEQVTPAVMASLWEKALKACEARKVPVDDAYGRRLRLSRLPADLLALTDPRQVVANKTRLPEDMENWPQWVAKEAP